MAVVGVERWSNEDGEGGIEWTECCVTRWEGGAYHIRASDQR